MESVDITGTRIIIGATAVKIDLVRKRRIIIGAAAVRIVLVLVLVLVVHRNIALLLFRAVLELRLSDTTWALASHSKLKLASFLPSEAVLKIRLWVT